jgi:site-specific recombinase XerD
MDDLIPMCRQSRTSLYRKFFSRKINIEKITEEYINKLIKNEKDKDSLEALQVIRNYFWIIIEILRNRQLNMFKHEKVFPELTRLQRIYNYWRPMIKKLKIGEQVLNGGLTYASPHDLRHTYATNYILNGGNLDFLRQILEHTDIKTTLIYITLAAKDLHENINSLTNYA